MMRFDFIYAVLLFIVASFLLVGALYLLLRRERLSGLILTGIFVLANAVFAAFYAGFILNDYENIKLFMNHAQHLAIPYLAVLWFFISLKLINRQKRFKWYFVVLLLFIPFITMLANFLYVKNGEWYQTLYYTTHSIYNPQLAPLQGFNIIIFDKGPIYYVQMAYNFGLLGLSVFNFYGSFRKSVFLAKTRSLVLLMVSFIGFLLIGLSVTRVESSPIDTTPIFTSIFAFVLFFALFHYELFDLVPKAYQLIFQQAHNPIFILDERFTVVNMNEKAFDFFGYKFVVPPNLTLAHLCKSGDVLYDELKSNTQKEISFMDNGSEVIFSVELLTLHNKYMGKVNNGYCAVFIDITHQKDELRKVEKLASYDALTDIYNRRHFYQLSTEAFDLAKIEGHSLYMTMFDLDDFKIVNDVYGHQAGDYVLSEMTSLFKKHIGENDIFARYGGEEFILMRTNVSLAKTKDLIRQLCDVLAKHPFVFNDRKIKITASFGVSGSIKHIDKSFEAYIKEADDMLYCAKGNGKNQVFFTNNLR